LGFFGVFTSVALNDVNGTIRRGLHPADELMQRRYEEVKALASTGHLKAPFSPSLPPWLRISCWRNGFS